SLRTAWRRARAAQAARHQEEEEWREHGQEPDLDVSVSPRAHAAAEEPALAVTQRRIHAPVEPAFEPAPMAAPRINARPSYDETEIDYPDEADDDSIPFEPDMP